MPGKKTSAAKGGKGGSGDGSGEGTTTPLELLGSSGDDRLRGGEGDDIFWGYAGNDTLSGNGGQDTAYYAGSVWGYSWPEVRKGYSVRDTDASDGDSGTDTLQGIETLQFSDAAIILGQDNPTSISGPSRVYTTVDQPVEYAITVIDYDSQLYVDSMGADINVGRIAMTAVETIRGEMGMSVTYGYRFSPDGYSTSMDLSGLAEGETITVKHQFEITSSNPYEIGQTTQFYEIEIVVAGVNDAPTLDGEASLSAVEDGGTVSLDLSQFGADVDSDDDGSSLSYEIVSAPEGFDVTVLGSDLILDPSSMDQAMTSDELMLGSVTVRAVDSHGAVSDEMTIELALQGADDPIDQVVTRDGVDYEAIGLQPGSEPNLGQLYGWEWFDGLPELIGFTDDGDNKLISASRVGWFNDSVSIEDESGTEIMDDTSFIAGSGNDALVFDLGGASQVGFEISNVEMGDGEDVLVISAKADPSSSGSNAVVNGVDIDTGSNSDQIWIETSSDHNGWITGDIATGSGNDSLHMRIEDIGPTTPGGAAFFEGDVDLGTGDDILSLVLDAGVRQMSAHIEIDLYAGEGNDSVFISNADTELVLNPNSPTGGMWDELYTSGLEGMLFMNDGDDLLELALNDPYQAGTTATIDGGVGNDVLVLHTISRAEAKIVESESADSVDTEAPNLTITAGNQTLNVSNFETILFNDDADYATYQPVA